MLTQNMNLREMLEFKPTDDDMAGLDLDICTYLKVSMISIDKQINYGFIRFLFEEDGDEIHRTFKDIDNTVFYDYEYKNGDDIRAITITELYSKDPYAATEILLATLMEKYSHDAEVVIDLYTHDGKEYRLSNLDGIVKNDQLK